MKNGSLDQKIENKGGWKEDRTGNAQTAATRNVDLTSPYYFIFSNDGALEKTLLNHVWLFKMMAKAIRDESQPLWKLN